MLFTTLSRLPLMILKCVILVIVCQIKPVIIVIKLKRKNHEGLGHAARNTLSLAASAVGFARPSIYIGRAADVNFGGKQTARVPDPRERSPWA